MEPAELNPPAPDDARFEALLREASTTLSDDGFSARVLAALPSAETQPAGSLRVVVCLVGAAFGGAFAIWRGVGWSASAAQLDRFGTSLANATPDLANPLIMFALVVTVLSLAFAFRAEVSEKLLP